LTSSLIGIGEQRSENGSKDTFLFVLQALAPISKAKFGEMQRQPALKK
jgi:hypothetical protein